MSKNLFILHTQYNLILGMSVLNNEYKNDENDLIVYAEFPVTEQLNDILVNTFNKVYYVRKKFEPLKRRLRSEKELKNQFNDIKLNFDLNYDRLIIAQDRPLEKAIFNFICKKNSKCICVSVEEDVYYTPVKKDEKSFFSIANRTKHIVRQIVRYLNIGYFEPFHFYPCYGSSEMISLLYVNFKNCIRKELKSKSFKEISSEALRNGIETLYGVSSSDMKDGKNIIIVSDLIERYKNRENVTAALANIIEISNKKGIKVHIKYHPRENNKLFTSEGVVELPTTLAVEKIFLDFKPETTLVIGNTSTAILTAKKLGFTSISIVNIEKNNPELTEIFAKMGILTPKSAKEAMFVVDGF